MAAGAAGATGAMATDATGAMATDATVGMATVARATVSRDPNARERRGRVTSTSTVTRRGRTVTG